MNLLPAVSHLGLDHPAWRQEGKLQIHLSDRDTLKGLVDPIVKWSFF